MPSIEPTLKDGPLLAELHNFIDRAGVIDPWLKASLTTTNSLKTHLRKAVEDIDGSLFDADEINLTNDEAATFIYYAARFLEANPGRSSAALSKYVDEMFDQNLLKAISGREVSPNALFLTPRKATRIFLVYGRNRTPLLELRHWLKEECGLDVVVFEADKAEGTKSVAEALEEQMSGCGTALIIATDDDMGGLRSEPKSQKPRARQNVILELGWLIGLLGRDRVVLLLQNNLLDDFPSDLAGVATLRFTEDVQSTFDGLRKKLQSMGVILMGPSR